VDWYLVRTKPGKERWVHDQLSGILTAVFLPLLQMRSRRASAVVPLFPCYIFAQFELAERYFEVKYMPGVNGLVSAGRDPLAIPVTVVEEIKQRGVNGVVTIEQKPFVKGDRVRVVEGPFRDMDAVFERYLSGADRVAILLGTVEAKGLRVTLPADALARTSQFAWR
jgi:transcriptional antiterminator RfaH